MASILMLALFLTLFLGALALLGAAAVAWGADSREVIGDEYRPTFPEGAR